MPRNGAGTMSLPTGNPVVTNTPIDSVVHNNTNTDLALGISNSVSNDGQTTILANLPMSGFRHTNVGAGLARTDYATVGQIQDAGSIWGGTAGGTADTLTLTLSPAISAYSVGQVFRFISGASPNATTTPTINVNSVGNLTFKRRNGTAVVAGDIPATTEIEFLYNGSNAILLNTVSVNANLTGPITSVGNATAIASQVGTGSTFVMSANPTIANAIIKPAAGTATLQLNDGVPTSTSLITLSSTLMTIANNVLPIVMNANTNGGNTVQLTLETNGNVKLNNNLGLGATSASTSGTGITFPATQSLSSNANTLDDYEEGAWTPALKFGNAQVGMSASNTGSYVKIGSMVIAQALLTITTKGSSTGPASISGLSFTSSASNYTPGTISSLAAVTYTGSYYVSLSSSSTIANLTQVTEAGVVSNMAETNFANGSSFGITIVYFA